MFAKAQQAHLVDFVVEQIETAIVEGRLSPGAKLPPTAELQDMLGTSRGTLREAFRVLRQKGLLQAKAGAGGGVFVSRPTTEPMAESLALLIRSRAIPLAELAQFREGLEGCAVELAAAKIGPKDIAALEALYARLEASARAGLTGWDDFHALEARLHEALARLSGNALYELNILTVQRNIEAYYGRYLPRSDKVFKDNLRDWAALIDTLAQGDGRRARELLIDHIHRFNEDMMRGGQDRRLDA